MIYIDPLFRYAIGSTSIPARSVSYHNDGLWCHMWCDVGEEQQLHEMALSIGLKRAWFQNKPGFPHYDLTPSKRAIAVERGCTERKLVDWLRENNPLLKAVTDTPQSSAPQKHS